MAKRIPYSLENSNLYYAAETGDLEKVKHGIAIGANPNYQEGQYTVLQIAVRNGHVQVVEYLLQCGADPNLKSSETGKTALMETKSSEMLKLLARHGVNPNLCDRSRNNALLYFTEYNYIEAARAWMELEWPMDCKEKQLHNKLLAQRKFDMLTVITGFVFNADTPIDKIAEFKAYYREV